MLTDPEEIRIISNAQQKNVKDPNRSREHFVHIFSDFLGDVDFKGATLLDIGPGQYDFGEIARERGANTYGIDKDPAVIELGQYKGFTVKEGRIQDIKASVFDVTFDGVFCKLSINAFWSHKDDQVHAERIKGIASIIKPGGWAWIAPWNGAPKKASLSPDDMDRVLSVQRETFKEAGFTCLELSEVQSKYYGVHGITENRPLFLYNLRVPESLKGCVNP